MDIYDEKTQESLLEKDEICTVENHLGECVNCNERAEKYKKEQSK